MKTDALSTDMIQDIITLEANKTKQTGKLVNKQKTKANKTGTTKHTKTNHATLMSRENCLFQISFTH